MLRISGGNAGGMPFKGLMIWGWNAPGLQGVGGMLFTISVLTLKFRLPLRRRGEKIGVALDGPLGAILGPCGAGLTLS